MRQAYVITAYKDPAQIERLIRRLDHDSFDFYIHLDKKIDRKNFLYLSDLERVQFIKKPALVRWGAHTLTVGILTSFEEILQTGKEYDFISVLSGQDYPIKPTEAIYTFLEKNKGKNFIYFEEPGEAWWSHNIKRVSRYHMTKFGFKGRYRIEFLINTLLPKRKFPLPYKMYGGPCATHMTLSIEAVRYLVDFMKSNKKLRQFSEYTWGSDEFLMDTLLMNSPLKDQVVNDNLYYIDWSLGGFNPKVFTMADLEALKSTDKLYARKFDMRVDKEVMDQIDLYNQALVEA